jgi:hypothetical protein
MKFWAWIAMTKKPTSEPDYISMDFEDARRLKWQRGITEHRNGNASASFKGEPCRELHQEMLDAANYLEEIERTTGANLAIARAMVRFIARNVQAIHLKH